MMAVEPGRHKVVIVREEEDRSGPAVPPNIMHDLQFMTPRTRDAYGQLIDKEVCQLSLAGFVICKPLSKIWPDLVYFTYSLVNLKENSANCYTHHFFT